MSAAYIPAKDADFDHWFQNFSTLIAANPTSYGLVAGDATTITDSYTAWHAAWLLITNPTTKTTPAVAAKNAQRRSAEATIRPFAQIISKNSGVAPDLITGLGLNLANPTRPPIPAPTSNPTLTLVGQTFGQVVISYRDTSLGPTKKKPTGAIGVQIYAGFDPGNPPPLANCQYYQTWTKSPNFVVPVGGSSGKYCTLYARWITKSGPQGTAQPGPWSDALSFVVM